MTRVIGAVGNRLMGERKGPGYRVQLDWRAYFYRFMEVHGEPVVYQEDKLLFSDGWQYTIRDYQGPEYPPPSDSKKLCSLKREYWELLQAKLKREYQKLKRQVKTLQEWQSQRDLPLQRRIVYEGRNDAGAISLMSETEELDLSSFSSKLNDFEYLLRECEENLSLL